MSISVILFLNFTRWAADRLWFWMLVQTGVLAAILVMVLKLHRFAWGIPFHNWGDTLWFSIPVKTLIEEGNPFLNTRLSAPFLMPVASFPSMTNFDWALNWAMSFLSPNAGVILNSFWLLSIFMTAWLATFALRLMGLRAYWLCALCGLIYSLLPYAFFRNVAHISLVYYSVPLTAMLSVLLAANKASWTDSATRWGLVGVILQGFGYLYYSFYSVLFLSIASILGVLRSGSIAPLKIGVLAITLAIGVSSINLLPTYLSWSSFGAPTNLDYKSAVDAEIYGLKLRQMVAPNPENSLPLLRTWAKSNAKVPFPLENENISARLGLLGSFGLCLSLAFVFFKLSRRNVDLPVQEALSSLNIFAILFATIGGFGALFNLLLPEFRAYNRMSVYIAFFSLAILAFFFEDILQRLTKPKAYAVMLAAFGALSLISMYDQILDARKLVRARSNDEQSSQDVAKFVQKVEGILPSGSMIYQLPYTPFPLDGGKVHMLPYDHARPYLSSSQLRWSWPTFSQQHNSWLEKILPLSDRDLLDALVLSGFSAVWIDGNGYVDGGKAIKASLIQAGAQEILAGSSPRYSVLDLTPVIERLAEQRSKQSMLQLRKALLSDPIFWSKGFYAQERLPSGRLFRWSRQKGILDVANYGKTMLVGRVVFDVASHKKGTFDVKAPDGRSQTFPLSETPTRVEIPVRLSPGEKGAITITSHAGRIDLPPGEQRDLHFFVLDPLFEEES